MKASSSYSIDLVWKSLLSIILFFYGVYTAKSILIPIVLSFFLSIILNPIVSFFERKGINTVLSIVITLLLLILLLGGGLFYISIQARSLINDLPNLLERLNSFIESTSDSLSNFLGLSSQEPIELLKENANELITTGSSFFGDALSLTSDFISFITLVPIYLFFMLLFRDNFKLFLKRLGDRNKSNLSQIATEIKEMVHNYIVGLFIVIFIVALLNTIGLLALGLEYALFMGVVSAILTIIPYIGIFIGGLLPVIVALLTKDSLLYPLAVIGIVAIVQFLEGNFITPKIVGSKVDVNPLAAIVALIIGGQVWGIVGMILAIPLTGITKIIFSHYKHLQPYAILLQSKEVKNNEQTKGE